MQGYSAIYLFTIRSVTQSRLHAQTPDPDFVTKLLVQSSSSDLWSRNDVSHSSHPMSGRIPKRYYYLFSTLFIRLFVRSFVRALVCLCVRSFVWSRSRALTIPSEVQAVQDVIYPLINHAPTSDHSSGPILLDHQELRLYFLLLGFVTKPTAYW